MSVPLDTKLYEQVKREAKRRFDVWPSRYATWWLSKEYVKRGGRYARENPALSWHLRNEDAAEILIGLLEQTGKTEVLLDILAEYYRERAVEENNDEMCTALINTANVLTDAAEAVELIWELE